MIIFVWNVFEKNLKEIKMFTSFKELQIKRRNKEIIIK